MMKIAILTPTYCGFSGIDRVVEQQVKELSRNNKVTILTLKSTMACKEAGIVELGMPKNPFFERIYRLLFFLDFNNKKYIRLLKNYDVVISHLYPMNYLAYKARKKFKIKYIYYNHGVVFINLFESFFERVYLRLFKFFNNMTIRNCDEAISVSRFLSKELEKETGVKSKVVYNPIDKKYRLGINKDKIRKKYKIKKNEKLLLYVGRISPHKGVDILIKIFNKVVEENSRCKLIIVGKHTFDDYSKKLRKLAKNKVIFAGFVPDGELQYYYAACDLYVTASLWEGFDLPIVEAQHCGKKAVAFDLCSHPEVLKKGKLVKPMDLEGFKKAILKLVK